MSDPITSPTIEGMRAHRSIRAYSSKPVDEAVLRSIMDAVQSMPNWVNCQHVSVVNVADKDLRKQVFEFCNQQPYVLEAPVFLVFCADFYRTWLACHEDQDTFDQVSKVQDNLMVGVTDAGIALGWAVAAAESLGLGTCVIGDARAHGPEMAKAPGIAPLRHPHRRPLHWLSRTRSGTQTPSPPRGGLLHRPVQPGPQVPYRWL